MILRIRVRFLFCFFFLGTVCLPAQDETATPGKAIPETEIVDAPAGAYRLKIAYWAEAPQLLTKTSLKGQAWNIRLIAADGKIAWSVGSGEAGYPEIFDYSEAQNGILRFTETTSDPRKPCEDVPFLLSEYRIAANSGDGEVVKLVKRTVLLPKEKYDEKQAQALKECIIQKHRKDNYDCDEELQRLRNMATDDPRAILKILKEVDTGDCRLNNVTDEAEGLLEVITENSRQATDK